MSDEQNARRPDLVVEREVAASPEEVWDALTTGKGLVRWFPLEARVEPGEGGSVWLSWGPGVEGEAPIHVWDAPRRFGWTESYGEDDEGRPVRVAVDFHLEGRGGRTLVRLVQSGFGASADWDEMYDALKDGWSYFLFNLAFWFERHAGRDRRMAWLRAPTALDRHAAWERLLEGRLIPDPPGGPGVVLLDREREVRPVSHRSAYHWAGTVPDLGDAVLFVELEGRHVGLWLSTYALDETRVAELQGALEARAGAILEGGEPADAT